MNTQLNININKSIRSELDLNVIFINTRHHKRVLFNFLLFLFFIKNKYTNQSQSYIFDLLKYDPCIDSYFYSMIMLHSYTNSHR